MAETAAESEKGPPAPPNLRAATDENECEQCTYFDSGACTHYKPLTVANEWTCDSFKRPQTLRGAAVIVKQHFAERRKAAEAAAKK